MTHVLIKSNLKRFVIAGSLLVISGCAMEKKESVGTSSDPITSNAPLSDIRSFAVTGHVYDNPLEFEYILKDIQKKKIPVLFVGGDIENTLLLRFSEFEKKYNVHIVPVPGNHEIQSASSAEEYYRRFGHFRAFDTEKTKFLLLDTMDTQGPEYPHGGVGIHGEQLAFLKEELAESPNRHVVVIMGHALWASSLTREDKLKMATAVPLKEGIDVEKIQFPDNDTTPNDWMDVVHPLLIPKKHVLVFAGDASLSAFHSKDGVRYITTGLRQKAKAVWVQKAVQSYVECHVAEDIGCGITYFQDVDAPVKKKI